MHTTPEQAEAILAGCLIEMAEAETNPVLEVIDLSSAVTENQKYPPGLLQFNHSGWRAYYHCHPASRQGRHRFEGEHGHFHIFVRSSEEPETWSHLVAVSMDNMGQPLGLFTVNQWVTAESWQSSEVLLHCLDLAQPDDEALQLVEAWLLALVILCKDDIAALLKERDAVIAEKQLNSDDDIKQDRSLYLLSETPVNLITLFDQDQSSGEF